MYLLSTKQQQIPDDTDSTKQEVVDLVEDPDISSDDDTNSDSDTSEDICWHFCALVYVWKWK